MATNKNKDSAALFELIDKSTLKVPKGAGSLKIPSWWATKENPPAKIEETTTAAAKPVAAAQTPAPAAEKSPSPPRLFEPSVSVKSGHTPSIRPPAPTTAANGTRTTPALAASAATGIAGTALPPSPAAAPAAATPRRFVPQTMDQSSEMMRRNLSRNIGSSRTLLSGVPVWAMVTGAALVVIFIVLIIFLMTHGAGNHNAPHVLTGNAGTGDSAPVAPVPSYSRSDAPPAHPQSLLPPPKLSNDAEETAEPGQVYQPGTIQRSRDLFYVVIATTVTPQTAKKDADFIAAHGVDVSIETEAVNGGKSLLYVLISVKGFPTMVDAEPFRKKIVAIGHLMPEFKTRHKVWDDAFVRRVGPASGGDAKK